jgi:glycyl-tRNA synthetase (class II)
LSVHDRDNIFKVKKSDIPDTLYKITLDHKKVLTKYGDSAKLILKQFKPITTYDLLSVQWKFDEELYVVSKIKEYQMITPNVIEPSIGIDRIFYTLICHNLSLRDDGKRPLLSLNYNCRVYDCMLAQLSNNEELLTILHDFMETIKNDYPNLKVFTDMSSTSIGKRYTRADEIGIQYSLTIDFDTIKDNTVTVRNSKDMKQIRMSFRDALHYVC